MKRLLMVLALLLAGCPESTPTKPPTTATTTASSATTASATGTAAPATTGSALLPDKPAAPAPAGQLGALGRSVNTFGFTLWQTIEDKRDENLAISPASIATALGMTTLGAEGETHKEMKAALSLSLEDQALEKAFADLLHGWQAPAAPDPKAKDAPPFELRVANRIYAADQLTVLEPYLEVTRRGFGAPLERLDFAGKAEPSRQHINQWVEQHTKDRIKELLPSGAIQGDTRMVLVNAMYMKAAWLDPFKESRTAPASFWVGGKTDKQVPTMHHTSGLRFAESADVTVVELPYRNERFAFTILLPKTKDGLAALEKSLSPAAWAGWIGALKQQQIALSLPKFVVQPQGSMQIKKPLLAMGMTLPFHADKAQFSRIVTINQPTDRLYFTEVYHQAFVEVNEAGTEAAAATAVAMGPGGKAPAKPVVVAVDHPFLFVIRDVTTDTILFLGRVTDPQTKS